jgi:hypothetical protein
MASVFQGSRGCRRGLAGLRISGAGISTVAELFALELAPKLPGRAEPISSDLLRLNLTFGGLMI